MAHDRLAAHVRREIGGDQRGQFLGDIAPHAVMLRERRLRIDVEARTQPEIISGGGIVRHALAAWTGVRRDEDETQFGADCPILALFGDVGMATGQAGQIPDTGSFTPGA